MSKKLFTICLLLCVFSIEVHAEDNLNSVIDGIQKKYEQINNFQALFTQESEVKALNKTQLAQGEVWFKKPGKMRWNYNSPNKDQIVSDGKTLWFYDEEEEQVIETPLAQVSETQSTTTLLSGLGNIKELFNASFAESEDISPNGSYLVDLVPKGDEEYNKVTISVNKTDMMVNTLYLYDPFGNLTTVKLADIKVDGGVSDSLFNFKTPDGAEVVKPPSFQ
ncbi:MAG: outer-membrane lipoprotein carrier protein [Thermodesulfobacteriota bacterium]|nr:MAG: outer-membrane lipoprotein carrier protein [Thermodesulfobacteriota bacterium]